MMRKVLSASFPRSLLARVKAACRVNLFLLSCTSPVTVIGPRRNVAAASSRSCLLRSASSRYLSDNSCAASPSTSPLPLDSSSHLSTRSLLALMKYSAASSPLWRILRRVRAPDSGAINRATAAPTAAPSTKNSMRSAALASFIYLSLPECEHPTPSLPLPILYRLATMGPRLGDSRRNPRTHRNGRWR
jgi:hypothetical protein